MIPSDKKPEEFSDEVSEKYQVIKAWVDMIAMNEKEKVNARDLAWSTTTWQVPPA